MISPSEYTLIEPSDCPKNQDHFTLQISGVWSKEQISIPVSFSEQANTGVAWVVIREDYEGQDPADVTFTLFDGNGQETVRTTETCPSVCQEAKFINEIFPDVPIGFQGILRISVMEGVDDPLTVTDEEWEEIKRSIDAGRSWVTGAALRMDAISSGIVIFSSVPVKSGLPRYKRTSSGSQDSIEGIPVVTDGDTLKIQNWIRMDGIDAPEASQTCRKDGQTYPCGWQAAEVLRSRISRSVVICRYSNRDQYQRILGTCFIGSENLSQWIVRNGWALAYRRYSEEYIEEEEQAKVEELGSGPVSLSNLGNGEEARGLIPKSFQFLVTNPSQIGIRGQAPNCEINTCR